MGSILVQFLITKDKFKGHLRVIFHVVFLALQRVAAAPDCNRRGEGPHLTENESLPQYLKPETLNPKRLQSPW